MVTSTATKRRPVATKAVVVRPASKSKHPRKKPVTSRPVPTAPRILPGPTSTAAPPPPSSPPPAAVKELTCWVVGPSGAGKTSLLESFFYRRLVNDKASSEHRGGTTYTKTVSYAQQGVRVTMTIGRFRDALPANVDCVLVALPADDQLVERLAQYRTKFGASLPLTLLVTKMDQYRASPPSALRLGVQLAQACRNTDFYFTSAARECPEADSMDGMVRHLVERYGRPMDE